MSQSPTPAHAVKPTRQRFLRLTASEKVRAFAWRIVWHLLFGSSPASCRRWRVLLLNVFGANVHHTASIATSAWIDYPWNLTIEQDAAVYHHVCLNCSGHIRVGKRARVSQYSYLNTHTHQTERASMELCCLSIDIGDDVWIGADTYVHPGVTIGPRTVVGARTTVMYDLPAETVAMGNPGVPVRARQQQRDSSDAV